MSFQTYGLFLSGWFLVYLWKFQLIAPLKAKFVEVFLVTTLIKINFSFVLWNFNYPLVPFLLILQIILLLLQLSCVNFYKVWSSTNQFLFFSSNHHSFHFLHCFILLVLVCICDFLNVHRWLLTTIYLKRDYDSWSTFLKAHSR